MRGRQQICILCRNIGRPARIIPNGRRAASQLRSLEPYDASKLILDLDAVDSKYVRRYEDQQEEQTTWPPVSVRDNTKAQVEGWKWRDPKAVPDLYRPNAVDFMRYALVDDTWKESAHKNAFLRRVLSKCLLPGLGKFKDHIKWLRAYEVLPYKVEQLLHIPNEQILQGIELAFSDCNTLYEISRITALMTNTVDGCKLVSSNGAFILHTIGGQVPLKNLRRMDTLKYINAVIQKLETIGVDPGPQWYGAGMNNAAKTLSYPALKKYIDIAMTKKDTDEKIDMKHLRLGLEYAVSWPINTEGRRRERSIDKKDSKGDLLRLLTGWDNLGVPEGDEKRKPCFALLLQDDRAMYEAYIKNLAKLEAYEALWYEFNHVDLTPTPGCTSKSDDSALFELANLFARAFIPLRDPLQALKVLSKQKRMRSSDRDQTFRKEDPTPSSSDAQPQFSIRDHASLSSEDQIPSNSESHTTPNEDVTRSTSILSIPGLSQDGLFELRRALAKKYLMMEVYDVDKGSLFEDLKRLELYTPGNMSDLLSVLSAYWTKFQDNKIRKWIHDHGPNNRVCRMAAIGVSRRLAAIGEEWKIRDDISDWYVPEEVQRLERLQADLHSPVPWTETEDDLLQEMVSSSWPGGAGDRTPEDWRDMAERMASKTEALGIYERYYSGNVLMKRYNSLAGEAAAALGPTIAKVSATAGQGGNGP
jgi:hypothetical protein